MNPLFLLVILCVYVNGQQTPAEPVPVTVYYESLCPDSMRFFTSQLFPTFTSPLRRYMNLTLVPYGKSEQQRKGEEWEFSCHHGPDECYGNKVQVCSLKHLAEDDYVKFINCLMSTTLMNKNILYPTSSCASTLGIDDTAIASCANSTEGANLLAEAGNKTITLKSVPTVVFQNRFNELDQEEGVNNFKSMLCSFISSRPKPYECQDSTRAADASNFLSPSIWFIFLTIFSINYFY